MIEALYLLSGLASALAWALSFRRPEHLPVAAVLTIGFLGDLARRALQAWALPSIPDSLVGPPLTGWVRAGGHVDSALFIAWPAGVSALAVWVYTRRRPWGVLAAYGLLMAVLVLGYPAFRGALLARIYLATELAAICVSAGCLLLWFIGKERTSLQSVLTGLIVVAEMTMLAGPWSVGIFRSWYLAHSVLVVLYVALVLFQGVALWYRRSSH